ncbi:MAG: hypothetical protein ABR992_13245 [Solirubrobacteraceae bacterium]
MSAQEQAGESIRPGQGAGEPSEEELRAAYEAELSRISTTDMIAQTAVSLLNIGATRLAPAGDGQDPTQPQRDLEQARDAIDAVKALLEILERRIPQELGPLRDALSRLQMAYARELQSGGGAPAPAAAAGQPAPPAQPASGAQSPTQPAQPTQPGSDKPGPGPAESSGRLWVPGR